MWKVDRDYLKDGSESRVGTSGLKTLSPVTEKIIRFRLLDDDEIVYYGGWLHDDDECLNQSDAYDWGAYDAGCTIIEVSRNGEWVREIG